MKKLFFLTLLLLPVLAYAADFAAPELVLVPKGNFQIGNNDYKNAKPEHKVILSNDFYIGKYVCYRFFVFSKGELIYSADGSGIRIPPTYGY